MEQQKKNLTEQSNSAVEAAVETGSQATAIPAAPHKNTRIWTNVFFVLSIGLSLYLMYQLSRSTFNDEKPFVEAFAQLNVKYFALAVATLVAMIFLDSLKYFVIMRATRIRAPYSTALTVGLLGKYYDNITPFASGGQPMQIYYLHKRGIGGGESSAVIFIKFAFNMTMWLTICFCLMLFNRGALATYVGDAAQRQLFTVAGWIGFAVNCALPLLIVMFVVFPKMTWGLTRGILHIGYKLKIVKDKDQVISRADRALKRFVVSFLRMIKRPFHSLLLALLCLLEPLLSMILPYLVVVALGGANVTPSFELMFAIMTLNVYASMSATIVPTPGNSGAVESALMTMLTSVSVGVLFWTGVTWRFLSYFSYIIIGTGITIFHLVQNNKSRKNNLN